MSISIWSVFAADINVAMVGYDAKSFELALPIFKRLAEDCDREALHYLGRMYENGEAVEYDLKEALRLFLFS